MMHSTGPKKGAKYYSSSHTKMARRHDGVRLLGINEAVAYTGIEEKLLLYMSDKLNFIGAAMVKDEKTGKTLYRRVVLDDFLKSPSKDTTIDFYRRKMEEEKMYNK